MSRSLIIGIAITFLIIGGLATFFYIHYIKVKSVPALSAIPNDAALIIESKNIQNGWQNFLSTDMWKDLSKNEAINHLQQQIRLIDSLVSTNVQMKDILADNKTAISFHSQGGQKLSMLIVAETGSNITSTNIINWIASINQFAVRKRNFESETVYDLIDKDKMPALTIAYREQLLICSSEGSLVEEAIRKLKLKQQNATKGLEQVAAMADGNSDASIYINYQYFPSFINLFTKSEYFGLLDYLKKFSNWSMFDLKFSKDALNFSGLSYTDDSVFQYLDLFKTQLPATLQLQKNAPKNTAMMLQISFSDYMKFAADLTEYLQVHKKSQSYTIFNDSLENRYSIDLGDKFISQIGNEAMLGMLETMSSDYDKNLYAMIKFKDRSQAESLLKSYVNAIEKRSDQDSLNVNQYNGYPIEHLLLGNFLKLYYGEIFEPIHSPFYTIINDAFVFANDLNTLKVIIDNFISGNTFEKDIQYNKYNEHSANTANVNFFFSPNRCFMLPSTFINDDFFSVLNRYQYDFKKFEYLSVQFANTNNKAFYTNINIKFNASFKEDTLMFWAVKLDTSFTIAPSVVYNSSTKQNCILVQDIKNTLYFINNSGNILWRSKLSGRILSEIKQVDAQKNGKIYYLFNTDKQACMIDENGNNLIGYPVRFPGNATTSLSMFDFNNDSNFQFFIPLENNRVIGYTISGKPIQGWNPKTVDEKIITNISSISIRSKKYLLATGAKGGLLIYSLKGERIKQTNTFVASGNLPVFTSGIDSTSAFVALSDTNGVFTIFTFDSTEKLSSNNNYNLSFKPEYIDARFDPLTRDWLVLAGTKTQFSIFDKANHKVFSSPINDSIYVRPFFNKTSSGTTMIGAVNKSANKINWFNTSGSQYPTFPLEGSSIFGIGNLLLDGNNYLFNSDKLNNLLLIKLK
jgi:hypothetical protein